MYVCSGDVEDLNDHASYTGGRLTAIRLPTPVRSTGRDWTKIQNSSDPEHDQCI